MQSSIYILLKKTLIVNSIYKIKIDKKNSYEQYNKFDNIHDYWNPKYSSCLLIQVVLSC